MVVGARPNFMKAAPIYKELRLRPSVEVELLHTGQHYDRGMSDIFFDELGLPRPDLCLGVGSGSHAEQTAAVMVGLERAFVERRPDLVVVVGDVNSTMAGALAAAKLCIPIAHVEAGLRSFDRTMPEEVNRVVTDSLSSLLFTTEESANANLRREGHPEERVHFVGNVMIDTLVEHRARAVALEAWRRFGLAAGGYALVTLHRPSNVDDRETLAGIAGALRELARELPVVFPAHPRTAKRLEEFALAGALGGPAGVRTIEPLGYLEFLSLMTSARMVLTDSGGMQDETTALGVPCITLRTNTERPVTVQMGTSELVGSEPSRILAAARRALSGDWKRGRTPPLWDGRSAPRIAAVLAGWAGRG